MRHSLRVRRYLIVLVVAQVDVARLERSEDVLYKLDMLVRRTVLDYNLLSRHSVSLFVKVENDRRRRTRA